MIADDQSGAEALEELELLPHEIPHLGRAPNHVAMAAGLRLDFLPILLQHLDQGVDAKALPLEQGHALPAARELDPVIGKCVPERRCQTESPARVAEHVAMRRAEDERSRLRGHPRPQ